MGHAGICRRCKGGVIWKGSVAASYPCGKCKGTGIRNARPVPALVPAAAWPAVLARMIARLAA